MKIQRVIITMYDGEVTFPVGASTIDKFDVSDDFVTVSVTPKAGTSIIHAYNINDVRSFDVVVEDEPEQASLLLPPDQGLLPPDQGELLLSGPLPKQ